MVSTYDHIRPSWKEARPGNSMPYFSIASSLSRTNLDPNFGSQSGSVSWQACQSKQSHAFARYCFTVSRLRSRASQPVRQNTLGSPYRSDMKDSSYSQKCFPKSGSISKTPGPASVCVEARSIISWSKSLIFAVVQSIVIVLLIWCWNSSTKRFVMEWTAVLLMRFFSKISWNCLHMRVSSEHSDKGLVDDPDLSRPTTAASFRGNRLAFRITRRANASNVKSLELRNILCTLLLPWMI